MQAIGRIGLLLGATVGAYWATVGEKGVRLKQLSRWQHQGRSLRTVTALFVIELLPSYMVKKNIMNDVFALIVMVDQIVRLPMISQFPSSFYQSG